MVFRSNYIPWKKWRRHMKKLDTWQNYYEKKEI
jgi:hypothetical protein